MNLPNEPSSLEDSAVESEVKVVSKLPKRQPERTFIAPMPGFVWNPLLTLPRNRPCPCLSGLKFKACCLHKLVKAVTPEVAKSYREQMSAPDLVFITQDNGKKVQRRLNGQAKQCSDCGYAVLGPHDCNFQLTKLDHDENS